MAGYWKLCTKRQTGAGDWWIQIEYGCDWQATGNNVPKGKQEFVIDGYRLSVAVLGRLLEASQQYLDNGWL